MMTTTEKAASSGRSGGGGLGLKSSKKNKAFQMLRRDMEQRNRQKKRGAGQDDDKEAVRETIYVDRDRAAAVLIGGNKDIKSDLKSKKKRDRETAGTGATVIQEEADFETHLLQGENALKCGDPSRALLYLSRAIEANAEGESLPYLLRCQCYTRIGEYRLANADADKLIKMEPDNVRRAGINESDNERAPDEKH